MLRTDRLCVIMRAPQARAAASQGHERRVSMTRELELEGREFLELKFLALLEILHRQRAGFEVFVQIGPDLGRALQFQQPDQDQQ